MKPALRRELALAVGLDDDELVVLVEAHVDRLAVGLTDLDLPGGAVLAVSLDRVGVAASGDLQRGLRGPLGLRRVGATAFVVGSAEGGRRARAAAGQGEDGSTDDEVSALHGHSGSPSLLSGTVCSGAG